MSSIGLLGLYIGQIHYEVKNRPLYFISSRLKQVKLFSVIIPFKKENNYLKI